MLIMDIVYGLRHQGDKFLMRDLSPRGRPLDLLVWRRSTQPVMVGSSIWRRWRRGGSCRGWSHHPEDVAAEDVVEEEEAVHVALGHVAGWMKKFFWFFKTNLHSIHLFTSSQQN